MSNSAERPSRCSSDRVALADVEEGDDELAGRRRCVARPERADAEHDRREHDGSEEHAQPRAAGERLDAAIGEDAAIGGDASVGGAAEPKARGDGPARPSAGPAAQPDRDGDRGRGYDVRRGEGERPGQADVERRERDAGRRVGDPLDVAEQRRAQQRERRGQARRELRDREPEHAEPHDRGDDRRRQQVGGQGRERDLLEVQRRERGRGERRGDGDRGRVGDGLGHAPAGERGPQGRRERQQARDRGERELPAGVAGGERVQGERDRRGEPERVPARRRAPRERGDQAGHPHHAGALDRRPAARQRHVHGDERQRDGQPRPPRDVERRAQREHQRAEEQDVLARHGEQMREPRAAEVVPYVLGDRLVLAEHHAAQQGGLRRREPRAEPARRPLAEVVEPPGRPAPRPPGRRPVHDLDGRERAAPALEGVDLAQRSDDAAERELAADARAVRHQPVRGPDDRHLAVQRAGGAAGRAGTVRRRGTVRRSSTAGDGEPPGQPHARGDRAVGPDPRRLEQMGAARDRAAH